MIKAEVTDQATVVNILTTAFADNLSVNYIVSQDNKSEKIKALMNYSFEQCMLFGNVYLSNDRKACALILYPQHKKTTLKSIWLDIQLILKSIGFSKAKQALKRESQIKKIQPKVNMAYLWFIGVVPENQQSGIGSKLLKEVITEAERNELPVFLETSTLKNLPWYERFGFKVYDKLDLTYTLYFLKH